MKYCGAGVLYTHCASLLSISWNSFWFFSITVFVRIGHENSWRRQTRNYIIILGQAAQFADCSVNLSNNIILRKPATACRLKFRPKILTSPHKNLTIIMQELVIVLPRSYLVGSLRILTHQSYRDLAIICLNLDMILSRYKQSVFIVLLLSYLKQGELNALAKIFVMIIWWSCYNVTSLTRLLSLSCHNLI